MASLIEKCKELRDRYFSYKLSEKDLIVTVEELEAAQGSLFPEMKIQRKPKRELSE